MHTFIHTYIHIHKHMLPYLLLLVVYALYRFLTIDSLYSHLCITNSFSIQVIYLCLKEKLKLAASLACG